MARSIDERIVKMSLENRDFEEKASRTTSIFGKMLDSFKKVSNTKLDKPANDISKINQESEKGSVGKLANQVGNATKNMGALGIAGVTALVNITNRAVDAGIQMAKSFTTKPIMDGFGEYELKMKSIQTILSNTQGKNSLKDVTGVLDELNTYADKTIYNFAEMTSNIGTFTAAGVGLEDSATAIKGIANLAAASGSNSQQASTAMYQLSQALATGSVKLQDWNSVVNAGMGGKLFQNALIKTADNMGIANSGAENFRDSLQDGWLTTDVLLATLQEFSEDQSMLDAATKVRTFTQLVDTAGEALGSGWAQTWEYILGDFDEAGKMWTSANDALSEIIEGSAKARNDLVKGVVDLGGRKKIIDAVSNSFSALMSVVKIGKTAFKDIFPPLTAKKLYDIISAFTDFTAKLKPSTETAEKLSTIFKALFAILDIGITVAKSVGRVFLNLIPKGVGGDVLDLVVKFSEMILKLRDIVKGNETLNGSFAGVGDATNKVYEVFKKFISFISGAFTSGLEGIRGLLDILAPYVQKMADEVVKFFGSFTSTDLLTGGLLGFIIIVIKKFKGLGDGLSDILGKIGDAVEGFGESLTFFSKLGDTLETMTANIKADTLFKIGIAIGVMAVSIKLLSTIPMQDLSKGIAALGATLLAMTITLNSMSKITGGVKTALYASTVLPALALSVLALAGALKVIASMSPEELMRGLSGLVGIFATLATTVIVISKFGGKLKTSSVGLLALATSVVILASAVKTLSKIKTNDLAKGMTGLIVMLGSLAIFLKVVNKSKFKMSSAIALTIISGAILVMVSAIKKIAKIDTGSLVKGLVTIGAILLELAIFTKLTSGSKILSASVGMLLISQAIKQLIPPIKELGDMDKEALAKGLTALGITLAEVVLAMRLAKGGLLGASAILVTAAAINVLVPALTALGNLTWEQIAKGLITLAGALGIIAIASNLIGVVGSIALIAFAAAVVGLGVAAGLVAIALIGFITALNLLAEMTDETVDNVVSALSGLITGLIQLVPELVELAITIVVSMAKGLAIAAPVLFEAALTIIIGLLDTIATNIGPFIERGSEIVSKLMEGIGNEAPQLLEAGVKMIVDLINGLATTMDENSEAFTNAVVRLMGAVLVVFVDGLVAIVDVLFGWIPGVEEITGDLGESAKEALRSHFNITDVGEVGNAGAAAYVSGIEGNKTKGNKAGKDLGSTTREGLESVKTGGSGRSFGQDFNKGVRNQQGDANRKGRDLSSGAKRNLEAIKTGGSGRSFGQDFNRGVRGQSSGARTAGSNVATQGRYGLRSVGTSGAGANFGEGFAQGIESKQSRVSGASSWLASVGKSALEGFLRIFSPSRALREDGGHFGEGFALGIEDKNSRVKTAATTIADGAKSMVDKTVDLLDKSIANNMDFEPRIKPIIDISKLKVPNLDNVMRLKALGDYDTLPSPNRQNGEQMASKTYNIELNVPEGDLTYEKAKQFAGMITTEIKNADDSRRIAIGEEVIY